MTDACRICWPTHRRLGRCRLKKANVVIGKAYLTKVSGKLVRVIITGKGCDRWGGRLTKFRCVRCDTQAVLPKLRTAAALRPAAQEEQL